MISWRGVVLCSLTGSSTVVVQFYGAVTDRRAEMFLPSVAWAVAGGTRRAGRGPCAGQETRTSASSIRLLPSAVTGSWVIHSTID